MAAPQIDVGYVAHLARLKLSPEETVTFQKQLSDVLVYVAQLEKADVSGLPLTGEESDFTNNLRADAERESFPVELALQNAPQQARNLFSVPKMVE